ncbi:MAG: hypothetical protein RRC07_02305 [Anaerolineae bacterium]|nr:hypothetical protein [Anaerolineae bacterium]
MMFVPSLGTGNYILIAPNASNYADRLFWGRYITARLHSVVTRLLGGSPGLQSLAEARQGTFVKNRRHAGVKLVALNDIRGSESRSNDFDAAFRPLHRRMNQRWVNLASAWLRGVVFEAVELIQIGSDYFVRDGHHRISVARATGQRYIDAEVTILDVGEHAVLAERPAVTGRPRLLNQGALVPVL